jgi:ribosomal protein L11 methyltransferase
MVIFPLCLLYLGLLRNVVVGFHVSSSFDHRRLRLQWVAAEDVDLMADSEDGDDYDLSVPDASSLRSMTFSNLRKDQEPQLLCNFLMELGACSTSSTDADLGTDGENPLFDEFDSFSMTRTAVSMHVWDHCDVSAHFPASTDFQWIMELVLDAFPDLPKYEVALVENKDWVLHVQKGWKPIVLPPFLLRFPWHTNELVQEALAASDGVNDESKIVELQLQGGIAFGTGEHPTTQLCMDWIAQVLSSDETPIKRVLDYGAGSGVLGMAACKLDPSVTAIGVDIDVDAVHIANANAEENKVDMTNYLSDLVQTTDDESRSVLLKAYGSKQGDVAQVLPKDLNGPFYDACVANILAAPLVKLAPVLAGLVRPMGKLGLSGIMSSQNEMILEAYAPFFDDVQVERELGGWILVTGTRKQE